MLAVKRGLETGPVCPEAGDQLATQLVGIHHVVHYQVRRQLVEVDVPALFVFQLLAAAGLLRRGQIGQLVEEDGVHGRLRAHHGDLRRG